MTGRAPFGLSDALERNIDALAARHRAECARAPASARIADAMTRCTGSLTFVGLHLAMVAAWVAINLGLVPGIPRFDPTFVILATAASVEAIFLSTFVLISQNRMQADADRRADLDLHISLLTEHELTRLAKLVGAIAETVGVDARKTGDMEDVEQDIVPERVLDEIEAKKS
jgi:uncharacterized membrane protein